MANSSLNPTQFNETQRENLIRLNRRLKQFGQLEQRVESYSKGNI